MHLRTIWIPATLCLVLAVPVMAQEKTVKAGTARYGDPTGTARKYQNLLYGVIKTLDAEWNGAGKDQGRHRPNS